MAAKIEADPRIAEVISQPACISIASTPAHSPGVQSGTARAPLPPSLPLIAQTWAERKALAVALSSSRRTAGNCARTRYEYVVREASPPSANVVVTSSNRTRSSTSTTVESGSNPSARSTRAGCIHRGISARQNACSRSRDPPAASTTCATMRSPRAASRSAVTTASATWPEAWSTSATSSGPTR